MEDKIQLILLYGESMSSIRCKNNMLTNKPNPPEELTWDSGGWLMYNAENVKPEMQAYMHIDHHFLTAHSRYPWYLTHALGCRTYFHLKAWWKYRLVELLSSHDTIGYPSSLHGLWGSGVSLLCVWIFGVGLGCWLTWLHFHCHRGGVLETWIC